MKIALVTEVTSTIGGVETRVRNMLKYLSKEHDVKLYTSENIINHPTIVNPPKRNLAYCLGFVFKLFFRLLKDDYDIIDAQGHLVILPAFFAARIKNKKIVITIHDLYLSDFEKMYKNKISMLGKFYELILTKLPCEKITVNSALAKRLNASNIPNGIDYNYIRNIKQTKISSRTNKKQVIFVGRLVPQKNVESLILAAYSIKDCRLLIVGEGNEEYKLKQMKNELKAMNIIFKKHLNYNNIIKLIKQSDILVMPSKRESMGIVILEALASGTAVISTKTDGPKDYIKNNKNGFLVDDDVLKIKEKLYLLLNDDNLRKKIEKNGIATASKYDWKYAICKISSLYKNMMKG
ncbi:MAG: glycosyltransferase family 4 protein [Candidatus Aenigmarchaeota archaeon]|nr:glycosyltransferase family 4 protein [Candidatus Aenigmarchaeota archaeon]